MSRSIQDLLDLMNGKEIAEDVHVEPAEVLYEMFDYEGEPLIKPISEDDGDASEEEVVEEDDFDEQWAELFGE